MTDETTQRLVPLLCFQCGMPINHKQVKFDDMLRSGASALEAFVALDIRRPCCRTNLNTACDDPRLRRRFQEAPGFAKPERLSRLSAKPYTLGTDGCVELWDERTPGGTPAASTTAMATAFT